MTDDELDRAILDLPLAAPPPGLRASILASTVYAPRPMLRTVETIALGVALAFMAWILVSVFTSHAPVLAFASGFAQALASALSNSHTLVWLSCGAGIAAIVTLLDGRLTITRRS